MKKQGLILFWLSIILAGFAHSTPTSKEIATDSENTEVSFQIFDTDSYIDANSLLMFVSNKGSFAYDDFAILGKLDGLYYPYRGKDRIDNGTLTSTLVFAAGIWIGGIDSLTGDTLISIAQYGSDYWPGPMNAGTFISNADTDPQYRVYKLYSDSMSGNPNQDYNEWPSSQGAPVDSIGKPLLSGGQTLWAVFNDANQSVHGINDGTINGLGIEIQNYVWASKQPGVDTLPNPKFLEVNQSGNTEFVVIVEIYDENLLDSNDYKIVTSSDSVLGPVWHLINMNLNDTILFNQRTFADEKDTLANGIIVSVRFTDIAFDAFEVVANASGPLDPSEGGALASQGFPSTALTNNQQVGAGKWAFHTGDNGGSSGGGTYGSYQSFLARTHRFTDRLTPGFYDYEMRFTGSVDSPGVYGSYAARNFQDYAPVWVPFEIWRIGINTVEDTTDDVRLTPVILDWGEDFSYNSENWGNLTNGGGLNEHSASPDDDDPYTDWIYWYLPADTNPGESGYLVDEANILNYNFYDDWNREIFSRTVLINVDGGSEPPFNQVLPEQGTIFRLSTPKVITADSFSFNTTPPQTLTFGPEDVSIYSKYKLFNKSSNYYKNFFICLWIDSDLGDPGDDFAGCDTLENIFYTYNHDDDQIYGEAPPAFGAKLFQGPIVSFPGDTALVDSTKKPDFRNIGMYSFSEWHNENPQNYKQAYQYMNGLDAVRGGIPFDNGTRYENPGDPVAGTGDLDMNSSDRRLFASFGPLDFAPGDSQQIIFKYAVGQGNSPLNSITVLKNHLNYNLPGSIDTCCIGTKGDLNGDSVEGDMMDINFLVNMIFKSGPIVSCPLESDLNSDGKYANILDLLYLINYSFRAGPAPGGCYLK